jgi:hypothetical protein
VKKLVAMPFIKLAAGLFFSHQRALANGGIRHEKRSVYVPLVACSIFHFIPPPPLALTRPHFISAVMRWGKSSLKWRPPYTDMSTDATVDLLNS